jgi:hypothetical protein
MKILELKENKLGLYKKEPHYNTSEFTVGAQHFKEFGCYTRHPINLSPNSQWYKFWVEEARRCLYGYNIGRDEIPGYFYWYLNYFPIEKAVKMDIDDKQNKYILPETALQYSINEKNKKDKDSFLLQVPTEEDYYNIQAERQTDFPDFWDSSYDTFWYLEEAEQSGEHGALLKTRGRGLSYECASMLDRNFYLIPRSKSYAFASEKEYLTSDGILTKAWDGMGHIEVNTPWGKRKSKVDTMMHKRASYMKMHNGIMSELGFGSEIMGLSFKANPDKGRGKRGKLIIWEEAGTFPDLLQSWNISLKSMAQGRLTFGLMFALGTGGSDISDLLGLEQLYTRGKGYRVHMIKNTFEPELGYDETALFIGEQNNHEIATDKYGNSHKEIALTYIAKDRERHLQDTKNREMHLRYCAEAPIKPSEALMQIGSNIFPIDLLKQQKAYLLSHQDSILKGSWIGTLSPDPETGKIEWKNDPAAIPIDHYPHNDLVNINGCIVIYEPPVRNKDGTIPYGMYISGNDNYDHDQATTESLGSTWIMSRVTERLVAEYTGRPATASMFYNTNMYLLMYYNAIQNFENNLKGLHSYMKKMHAEHMLCDTPDIIKDKIDDKRVLSRGKGTPGTTPIIKYGLELILEYLMREAEPGTGILNLHKIKSVPLLDELIYYNYKGNFDRVLSLIYLLILHEDRWQHKPVFDKPETKSLHPFFANNPLIKLNERKNNNSINNMFNIKPQENK